MIGLAKRAQPGLAVPQKILGDNPLPTSSLFELYVWKVLLYEGLQFPPDHRGLIGFPRRFFHGRVNMPIGDSPRAQVSRNAKLALLARLRSLPRELFGVTRVIN